jgi:imidazolonepropionase-like amidohydrolase
MTRNSCVLASLAALAAASLGFAQSNPIAYTGAHIIPIAGAEIPNGVLVVQNGKIVAVGASGAVDIPSGAQIVDASSKVIMAGIVDSHSHIGEPESGKDGDVALYDGDPFEYTTHCVGTVIDGKVFGLRRCSTAATLRMYATTVSLS